MTCPELQTINPDQRGAERATLLLRSAKLVCQSGEYVCMLRDVSTTGVRLRLFHAVPPEDFVFLELGNGEIHPVEKRWTRGQDAGFRFAQPVAVSAFMAEACAFPRRPMRLRLTAGAQLRSAGHCVPARLHDLSQAGARIETTLWLALHQPVRLTIDGLAERSAVVCWRNRYEHGLVFQNSLRLDEFARQALTLQPLSAPPPVQPMRIADEAMPTRAQA